MPRLYTTVFNSFRNGEFVITSCCFQFCLFVCSNQRVVWQTHLVVRTADTRKQSICTERWIITAFIRSDDSIKRENINYYPKSCWASSKLHWVQQLHATYLTYQLTKICYHKQGMLPQMGIKAKLQFAKNGSQVQPLPI